MKQLRTIGMLAITSSILSACASLTPTREVTEGYRIYDIKGTSSLSALANNLKSALQENSDKATFRNGIPPHPLPQKPDRFSVSDPFANSAMGALMAASGGGMKIPKCDNSPFTGMTKDNFDGAENTTFFVCLQPYAEGYHMDIYYTFTKVSGGFDPVSLSKSLVNSVMGDSSQFIPRTIASLETAAKNTGASVNIVDSYPK